MHLSNFKLATYRFNFRAVDDFTLHEYAGSALRGAFGHALMQLCGIQKSDVQNQTPLYLHSPYAEIFEPKPDHAAFKQHGFHNLPPPYVIKAPNQTVLNIKASEVFSFELVLVGQALDHLALIILAFRRALLSGLGKHKTKKAELVSVEQLVAEQPPLTIYSEEKSVVLPHQQRIEVPSYTQSQTVILQLITPLRLQVDGKVLKPDELSAAAFIKSLIRRCSIYLRLQNAQLDNIQALFDLADTVKDQRQLDYQYWERYSNRQRQKMIMDGAVGQWTFFDVPAQLLPFFYLGQFLHNGKNTVFGLGRYLLQEVK